MRNAQVLADAGKSNKRYWLRCKIDGFEETLLAFSDHMIQEHSDLIIGTPEEIKQRVFNKRGKK